MVKKVKTVYFNEAILKLIEDWRKTQETIPSFTAAVELLINRGLEAELQMQLT